MKRIGLDLAVTACGAVTSVITALILGTIQRFSGLAIHAFSVWFVLPAGAILSGMAAATGYRIGARLLHYRPTSLLRFTGCVVAVGTYFLIYYFQYSSMTFQGRPIADLMTFGAYLDATWTHTRLLIQGVIPTGPLGSLGYLKAGIQAIGFMVGPVLAYRQTQNIPYCDRCSQAPDQNAFARRFTTFPGDIEKAWETADAASAGRRFDEALAGFERLGHETFSPEWPFRCSFTLYRCGSCGDHIVDCLSEQKTGVLWRRMGDLSRRKLVPVAGLGG